MPMPSAIPIPIRSPMRIRMRIPIALGQAGWPPPQLSTLSTILCLDLLWSFVSDKLCHVLRHSWLLLLAMVRAALQATGLYFLLLFFYICLFFLVYSLSLSISLLSWLSRQLPSLLRHQVATIFQRQLEFTVCCPPLCRGAWQMSLWLQFAACKRETGRADAHGICVIPLNIMQNVQDIQTEITYTPCWMHLHGLNCCCCIPSLFWQSNLIRLCDITNWGKLKTNK